MSLHWSGQLVFTIELTSSWGSGNPIKLEAWNECQVVMQLNDSYCHHQKSWRVCDDLAEALTEAIEIFWSRIGYFNTVELD